MLRAVRLTTQCMIGVACGAMNHRSESIDVTSVICAISCSFLTKRNQVADTRTLY